MIHLLRARPFRLGLLASSVLAFLVVVYWYGTAHSQAEMPDDRRAYLAWLSSIHQGTGEAVQGGLDLLGEYPTFHPLYLRLAEVCQAEDAYDACRAAFEKRQAPDAQTVLYRKAALGLLASEPDTVLWQEIARSPALTPTLARYVVDRLAASPSETALADVRDQWQEQLAADSSAVGAAFGLGYAIGQRDMDAAEQLLLHALRLAPDDPQIHRELGRIYFYTGQTEAFESTLRAGIEAASARHDLEQALILRGNLGLGLMKEVGGVEKAQVLFEEALQESRQLADEETEGYNLYRLAGVRMRQHRYDEALALLDSADVRYQKHTPRKRTEVQILRGTALTALFRFGEARQLLEDVVATSAAQRNIGAQIQSSLALAQLYFRMGSYGAARNIGLEVLDDGQQYRLGDIEVAARIVLGDVERRLGNMEEAEAHYEQGLELVAEGSPRQTELYMRLGRTALDMQDASAAELYYSELVTQVEEREGTGARAQIQEGLGWAYSLFGNYEQAELYFDEAIAEYREEGATQQLVSALLKKAWTLIDQADYEAAETVLEEATELTGSYSALAFYASRVETAWGSLRLNQARYNLALRHLERAEQLEAQHRRPLVRWHVLHALALAHWGLGNAQEAERYFSEAVEAVEAMRDNLDVREHRAAFVQDKVSLYKNFSAFLEGQGRSAEAFHYAERSRSRSLADLLVTTLGTAANPRSGNDLKSEENQVLEIGKNRHVLRGAIDDPEEEIGAFGETADPARTSTLQREYARVDSVYQERVQRLPDSSAIKPLLLAQPLDAAETQAVLKPGEAMIVYDLRSEQDGTLDNLSAMATSVAYIITPEAVTTQTLSVEEESLAEMIRLFREQIQSVASEAEPGVAWEVASRRLYQDLVAPVLAKLPASTDHLHLVPEGVLHYLPFAALQDEKGRFLIEDFSLSVTPSASILEICRRRNPRGLWRTILAVADPEGALPGSRSEALAIASIDPSIRGHALIGEDATQEEFEDAAEWADIIHIATHGRFVSQAPWSSYLELHGDVLSADEIGHLKLDAYLVTLSACETALSGGFTSDVPAGDEWVGLNQAFLAAGTPTVMASLWPIDDKVSSSFMISFYEKLLDARGKSKALSQAQRGALSNPETSHPFYWAAFTVIGDPL